MQTPNELAQRAVRVVAFPNIAGSLLLRAKARVRAHQVPRVEHDSHVVVFDSVEQATGHRGIAKRESRPPLVFQKEGYVGAHAIEKLVDQLARTVANLAIGMTELVRVDLAHAHVRYVEHCVLGSQIERPLQVFAEPCHELRARFATIAAPHRIPRAEFFEQCGLIALPEINPGREKEQVIADDQLCQRLLAYDSVVTPHDFETIEPEFGAIARKPVCTSVLVEVPFIDGDVGQLLHICVHSW